MKYFGTITDPKDLVNKEYIDDVADTKANIDGAYENMTVGNAEQLVSTVMVNDQEPYIFRTSGGSADIGDREYDTIVGGSLAWNQLALNPDFAGDTLTGWSSTNATITVSGGIATLTATAKNGNIRNLGTRSSSIAGHKVLISVDAKTATAASYSTMRLYHSDGMYFTNYIDLALTPTWGTYSYISTQATINVATDSIGVRDTAESDWQTINIKNMRVIDLTQLFGTTIADYIYNLEQSNAGDGVAWFRRYFPNPYYAYNAGELLHVQGLQSHKMVGFNAFDKTKATHNKRIHNGSEINANGMAHSDYIPIIPNTEYYFKSLLLSSGGSAVAFYDINKTYIQSNFIAVGSGPITSAENAYYCIVNYLMDNEDIVCVNLSWDGERNGEYEPYKLNSYPLDSSLTLRGVPVLDANNKMHYDGDIYADDGTVDRRYGIVDLGTLEWTKNNDNYWAPVTLDIVIIPSTDIPKAVCPKYPVSKWRDLDLGTPQDHTLYIFSRSGLEKRISIYDSTGYADAAAFKTALQTTGAQLVYELATPTTETAEPFQSPQIVDDFGTEEYVTTAQSGVLVPVGHNTNYTNNLRAKLEMAPESPSGDGDYIVRQTSGQNAYVPLVFPVDELPVAPSEDGTYTLNVTISGGTATYSWVSV